VVRSSAASDVYKRQGPTTTAMTSKQKQMVKMAKYEENKDRENYEEE
jgi:hypothetical protein